MMICFFPDAFVMVSLNGCYLGDLLMVVTYAVVISWNCLLWQLLIVCEVVESVM